MGKGKIFSHLAFAWQTATVVALFILTLVMSTAPAAQAQSFQVIHFFTGDDDGATPAAGLTPAAAGKFYGTASGAGNQEPGVAFELTPGGLGWALAPLNSRFPSGGPGGITIGPSGALFLTTYVGGRGDCVGDGSCGQVYELQPPAHACGSFLCSWNAMVLYDFNDIPDAGVPGSGVIFDSAGNMYGTTEYGGSGICYNSIHLNYGCGAVYKVAPSGGGWTETVIYSFQGGNDGQTPSGGLSFDSAGNLYGATAQGGSSGDGTIYELSPSGSGWTETILHNFQGSDGIGPGGTLIADHSGNLYGTAGSGGANNGGVVFEMSQPGSWTYNLLYSFPADYYPAGTLVFDGSGNLYGTTYSGGAYGLGNAYKLTLADGSWTATDLHDFQTSDGTDLNGALVFDSAGNLYGTAKFGGMGFDGPCYGVGCGTVWEITP
ncbi:MAG: choice-of-anchor tandem repeat GloVer-containing protein [Candidatus Korobacteraceae bacterium]